MQYQKRTYRELHRQDDLVHFKVSVKETDLDVGVRRDQYFAELVEKTRQIIKRCREPLEKYIREDPGFFTALTPYEPTPHAPQIVIEMAKAASLAGVGPMASVAGTIAQNVGNSLAKYSRDVIVENGGDIYLRTGRIRYIGIFAGKSILGQKLALEIRPRQSPLGICTSSGTVGHSLSFGVADAVIILSRSAALADAVATASANLVHNKDDLAAAVDFALSINGVDGALAIMGDMLAFRGHVKLVPLNA
ncbi:MAG: ApbE family lipoprotein [Desulfotomaculum sp. 46_296]|nr:MAG: ApbE family lipoprotein [Desulfotomaculum sp. 46_296]KUK84306.1 MAG: ApbE family lipoprotein [Desulfofundulus kuznetsovii]HAU30808.1 hypothetical protein [Desulfotomaculum sp.]